MTNDDKTGVEEKEKVHSILGKIEMITKIIEVLSITVVAIKASAILNIDSEEKRKSHLFEQSWKNWNA